MASRRVRARRHHAGSAAEGLCLRDFPNGGKRRRPGALLDRTRAPRHHSARPVPRTKPSCAHGALRAISPSSSTMILTGYSMAARSRCRAGPAPGSIPAFAISTAKLYERGDCHTVEVYDGDKLVGGLYGVSLGRAFFGESMFHRARDASKVALVHLVARLRGRALPPARHPVRHRASAHIRRGRGFAARLPQAARCRAGRRRKFRRTRARPSGFRQCRTRAPCRGLICGLIAAALRTVGAGCWRGGAAWRVRGASRLSYSRRRSGGGAAGSATLTGEAQSFSQTS